LSCLIAANAADERATEVLRFADALLTDGDHYRAIGEYKRFLFLAPSRPEAPAVQFRIGLAYLRGGQPEAAQAHLESIIPALPPPLREQAELDRGYAAYLSKDHASARFLLSQWLSAFDGSAPGPDRQRARYLLAWSNLSAGEPADFSGSPALALAVQRLDSLSHRSPWLAGVLSIVPGGGHLYIGQPWIAASAFAWNGLFGYGLYDSIRTRQVGVALVLGLLEVLWYSGTIFGAVSGAQKFNRDARLNALDGLREHYDDRPESWPPAP